MTAPPVPGATARLLTVEAAAERLSTSIRFVRRLIAERRIEFVKIGRHVRIRETALAEFIEAGRVEPIVVRQEYGAGVSPLAWDRAVPVERWL